MAMPRVHQTGIGPRSRRGLGAVLAATADPCAASEIAKTVGNVAINAGMYLDSHPQTNQVLTTVARQPAGSQSPATLKAYFGANPQAARDLQYIQQPLSSLTMKSNLPISLPRVLGLMQSVHPVAQTN